MMTVACYENGNDNDESDNNENKVYLLLRRWDLISHILDHMLDHMITGFVTTALELPSSLALALTNK